MANFGRTLDGLRRHGVTHASWHPDGTIASVQLGPLSERATKSKPGKLVPFQQTTEPAPKRDLDVLDDLPEMGAEA